MSDGRYLKALLGGVPLAALLLSTAPASATLIGDDFGAAANFAVLGAGGGTNAVSGTINGDVGAVGSMTNAGHINGDVFVSGPGTLVNNSTGVINGDANAMTLVNTGSITGAVNNGATGNANAAAAVPPAVTGLGAGISFVESNSYLALPAGPCGALATQTLSAGVSSCISSGLLPAASNVTLTLDSGGLGGKFLLTVETSGGGGYNLGAGSTLTILADSPLDEFVFRASSLAVLANVNIVLGGSSVLDNIVFDLGSLSVISGSDLTGNFVAKSSIGVEATATICGRALSQGSFNILGTVNFPTTCTAAPPQVPEPATLSIFGFGLAGLGFRAFRRRKQAK
jgi:hypothetical protein